VGTVHAVAYFLLRLGRLGVMASCTFAMFLLFTGSNVVPFGYEPDALLGVSSPLLPMLACVICSHSVACFCFSVFETAIDTILLSFCEDLELNKDAHSYFMSVELSHYIDKHTHKPPKHNEDDDDDDDGWANFPSDDARSNSGLRLDDGEMKENPLNAGAAGGSGGGEGANHTGEERANDLKMFNKQHGHGHGKAGVHAHGHHSHFGGGHKKKEVELVPKGSVANMAQADV
jgi:hypothetical protein